MSPSREAIQAAAREAAEQAIHLADAEDRKSPNDHHATGMYLFLMRQIEGQTFSQHMLMHFPIPRVAEGGKNISPLLP